MTLHTRCALKSLLSVPAPPSSTCTVLLSYLKPYLYRLKYPPPPRSLTTRHRSGSYYPGRRWTSSHNDLARRAAKVSGQSIKEAYRARGGRPMCQKKGGGGSTDDAPSSPTEHRTSSSRVAHPPGREGACMECDVHTMPRMHVRRHGHTGCYNPLRSADAHSPCMEQHGSLDGESLPSPRPISLTDI